MLKVNIIFILQLLFFTNNKRPLNVAFYLLNIILFKFLNYFTRDVNLLLD